MLNVRISKELEEALEILSREKNITKTEIVKEALAEYLKEQNSRPYDTGKDLFGCDEREDTTGSVDYKNNIRRHLHEKHTR
jgi:hypothetical protein